MFNFLKPKPAPLSPPDSIEEHNIQMEGIHVVFHNGTKSAFLIDQLGSAERVLKDYELWLKDQGWFLYWVASAPPVAPVKNDLPADVKKEIERATHGKE